MDKIKNAEKQNNINVIYSQTSTQIQKKVFSDIFYIISLNSFINKYKLKMNEEIPCRVSRFYSKCHTTRFPTNTNSIRGVFLTMGHDTVYRWNEIFSIGVKK